MTATVRILIALSLLAGMVWLGGCSRGQPRDRRPTVIIPDMEFQKKFKAQNETGLFADGRTMRTPPAGTVARGTLKEDVAYFTGMHDLVDSVYVVHNPRPLTRELLDRGQDRYEIFCSPCHGRTGSGKGIVVPYEGMVPPTSFQDVRSLEFANGYIFNVISFGVRNMPSYGPQIPADDRWAIVAYVRALQRSQNATLADVPEEARGRIR
jgi:hypothetical protein